MSNIPRYHLKSTPTTSVLRCRNQSRPPLVPRLSTLLGESRVHDEVDSLYRLRVINSLLYGLLLRVRIRNRFYPNCSASLNPKTVPVLVQTSSATTSVLLA